MVMTAQALRLLPQHRSSAQRSVTGTTRRRPAGALPAPRAARVVLVLGLLALAGAGPAAAALLTGKVVSTEAAAPLPQTRFRPAALAA